MNIVVRLARVFTMEDALDLERVTSDHYQSGSFQPLLPGTPVPVVIDHDESRAVGRVTEVYEYEDWGGGRWFWVRASLTDPPGWLSKRTGASFGFIAHRTQDMGDWRRVLRMSVTEVSLLSPSVEPAEPRARVTWIGSPAAVSTSDRAVAGDTLLAPGRIVRRNIGKVLRVR